MGEGGIIAKPVRKRPEKHCIKTEGQKKFFKKIKKGIDKQAKMW